MYHIYSAVHCIYMKWVQFQIFSVFRHAMSVPPSFALSLSSAISIPIQLSAFDCVITLSMTVMSAVSWRGIRVHPFPSTEPRYRRCKQSWLALRPPSLLSHHRDSQLSATLTVWLLFQKSLWPCCFDLPQREVSKKSTENVLPSYLPPLEYRLIDGLLSSLKN